MSYLYRSRAKCRTCLKVRVNMAAPGGGRPICRECWLATLSPRERDVVDR